MKKFATLIVTLGLMFQGSAFAIGAIAVDDSVGDTEPGYGFVTGEDSEAAAKAGAMKQCKSTGNDNCKVVVWFKTCGAYASSKKTYGYGFGASKGVAEKAALEMCGQGSCKIIIADCE